MTGSQGKYKCTCGHPHATIVDSMSNNDTRNVILLLDNKQWMTTLMEKINALLVSLEDNNELSTVIDKFQKDMCIITKAKSFFNILDGFKKLLNSSSFQMDKTKICVIPYSFHARDLEVSPLTKVNVKLGKTLLLW